MERNELMSSPDTAGEGAARQSGGPIRPAKLDLRIRNQIRAIAIAKGEPQWLGPMKGSKLSQLRAKVKAIIRAPADTVRRFMNSPVRAILLQHGQELQQLQRLQLLESIVARQDEQTVWFSKRLDELEVKIRPLVSLDDAYAVRLGDGYVLAPKDELAFVLMLADATSGGLEPGTRLCLKRLLAAGETAVDIGANIGLLTLAMARAVGPGGKVFSFEPEKRMADLMERMIAANGLSQTKLFRNAVSAKAGKMTFHVSSIPGHSSLFALPEKEVGHDQKVDVVRLDDVIPADHPVDVVKIDVEGAEMDVLAGMGRVLSSNPNIAVIAEFGISHLRRVGVTSQQWFGAFAEHGLRPMVIEEPTGNCKPVDIEKLETIESANIAFVRPGTARQRRLGA
jgi:FkbM family methyltransferase